MCWPAMAVTAQARRDVPRTSLIGPSQRGQMTVLSALIKTDHAAKCGGYCVTQAMIILTREIRHRYEA